VAKKELMKCRIHWEKSYIKSIITTNTIYKKII